MIKEEVESLRALILDCKKRLDMNESNELVAKNVAFNHGLEIAVHVLGLYSKGHYDQEVITRAKELNP